MAVNYSVYLTRAQNVLARRRPLECSEWHWRAAAFADLCNDPVLRPQFLSVAGQMRAVFANDGLITAGSSWESEF